MIAVNANDTFYADPFPVPFLSSDSVNTHAAQPPASSGIDPKIASHAVASRGEGELWDYMRASNEPSSDMAAGELEDIILRAASSSAVQNGVALPSWSLDFASDAVVPAATAATSAGGVGGGFSYYTAQADAASLPQNTAQNAPQNTAPQQFHQEWSNGGAWANSGREYQSGNGRGLADFQGIRRQNASTASTIADAVAFQGRTDNDFANIGEGMSQFWSQDAGGTATAPAAGVTSHAASHDGAGFSPGHLPAILRSLAAHQQAVEALAPLATEPRRQTGEWDGRAGEGAVRAAAGWCSSASLPPAMAAAAAAAAASAPGFLPADGVFPPLPLTRPALTASFQRSPPSAALAAAFPAAFPASSSSASSAHLAASVAASLAGERLALVGGGTSFETSQDPQLPQLEPRDGSAGHGLARGGMVSKAGAEATAEPGAAQNSSAIDALASMILVAAAAGAAGGQGGGFAPRGPQQAGMGGASASSGGIAGGDATGGMWGGIGGGMDGGMGGGMVGGVGGEGDEWCNGDVVGKVEADGAGYGDFGNTSAGHGFYGHVDVDAQLQRRNTATSGTGNVGTIGDVIVSTSTRADVKRARRSSSSGSLPPPLHHSYEDTCPASAAAFGISQTRQASAAAAAAAAGAATGVAASSAMAPLFAVHQKSSPQNLRLPAAASAALPLSAQIPQSLREQLQQQLQLQQLQRQQSNLSGSVSGGGGASGGGASGGAASGGEGRTWAGTTTNTTTTTSLGGMAGAVSRVLPLHTQAVPIAPSAFETSQTVSGAFLLHTQTAPIAPSPLPIPPQPVANPLHPPRSTFPPSAPPDSPLIDEKPDAVAQATAEVGRKRQARGETRKRGRGGERGGRVAGGRQQGASDGAWEEGGAGRIKQQGASEGAWEVRAGDGGAGGGASAAVGGFEEGEGAEGTRTLGRVSGACLAARKRRERIASQMRTLQRLVPGSSRVDTVSVLSDTIRFLCSLIHQIQSLGAEPEGYSTREAAEAAAAEVQKLVRDDVIASRRPTANQRAPSQGVTAADPAVEGGAAVAAEGPIVPGRAVAASGAVASPNAPQGSTHTSSQGPSQSMLPTVSTTSPSLEGSMARGDGDAVADADGSKDGD
ncbi:unnamed protein product [Closterium sp. Naga37s-1]|nr:unnamed protein product [Closterium sp. Naga37s-1]